MVSRAEKIALAIKNIQPNCTIDHDRNSSAARRRLNTNSYDFVLVDILLPRNIGDIPSSDNGLSLIRQLNVNENIQQPYIVWGITSHAEQFEDLRQLVEKENSYLTLYDEDSDEWLNFLSFALQNITRSKRNEVDLLIMTTTSAEEEAIYTLPNAEWDKSKGVISKGIFYSRGVIQLAGAKLKIACIRLNRMGMIDSAIATTESLQKLRPKLIIMTGICGGIEGKVKLGDVIVASESWDWQRGKLLVDDEIAYHAVEPDSVKLPDTFLEFLRAGIIEVVGGKEFKRLTINPPKGNPSEVKMGPIVSGSSVISDSAKAKAIVAQHRGLLGLDMEIFGFYSALRNDTKGADFFAIKAVCDLANEKKDDKFHVYCSHLSAGVAIGISEIYFKELALD